MLVIPIYDMLLLPGVTFYFKKDTLAKMEIEEFPVGEDVLFVVQKPPSPLRILS